MGVDHLLTQIPPRVGLWARSAQQRIVVVLVRPRFQRFQCRNRMADVTHPQHRHSEDAHHDEQRPERRPIDQYAAYAEVAR